MITTMIIIITALVLVISISFIVITIENIKTQCQDWTRGYYETHPDYNKNESVYEKCLNENGLTQRTEQWKSVFRWDIRTPVID